MPPVVIIINPVSGPARRGRGDQRAAVARRTLERLNVAGDVRLTERAGHAHEIARDAAASGAELAIAWGGDGTINEVGRALVQGYQSGDTACDLGIIPGGSGNGLARELQIPFDPASAITRAIQSPPRVMDVGELGEHLFFNVAGIGLDAHVAALVSTRVRHRGFLPYIKASFGDLIHYTAADYTIDRDGTSEETTALVVAFGNSRQYGFGAQIAPAALTDDGFLDFVAIEDRGFVGNMVRVPSLFLGRLNRQPGIRTAKIRELTIRSRSAMLFHVDGEAVQGSDTLIARVHHNALRLRA